MRLKVFRAPDVRTAMSAVRDEMGLDALILATRRVANGVELTAALEPTTVEPLAPPPLTLFPSGPSPLVPLPPPVDPARAALLAWHGVPDRLAGRLCAGPARLDAALAATLPFGTVDLGAGSRPVLLTGPPGAGKTLTAARMATRLVMAGAAPLMITADGKRAGAAEQLAAFTRLLGLTLIVANHPATLSRALAQRRNGDPVLIDAPGMDPFDPAQRDELLALAATADASTVMVMPAGLDVSEAAEEASAFADAGAALMVATRLDLSKRLGSVLAASDTARLALAEAGTGPGAADGLVALRPALLAQRLSSGARGSAAFDPTPDFRHSLVDAP